MVLRTLRLWRQEKSSSACRFATGVTTDANKNDLYVPANASVVHRNINMLLIEHDNDMKCVLFSLQGRSYLIGRNIILW